MLPHPSLLLLVICAIVTIQTEAASRREYRVPSRNENYILIRQRRQLDRFGTRPDRWNDFSPNSISNEYTSDGIVFRGGVGLPSDFVGSGSPDFAFTGDSFRPSQYVDDNQSWQNQNSRNPWQNQNQQRPWQNQKPRNPWQNQNQNQWQNPSQNNQDWWNNQNQNNNAAFKTTTSAPSVFNERPEIPNECQLTCHLSVTSEYNPMCGSDGVTYYNPGKFRCAQSCGRQITGRMYQTCGSTAPKI